jgi:hypothetical protein
MDLSKTVTLLGKVDRRILKRMKKEIPAGVDNTWYFVDYTSSSVKINDSFDVLLEGLEKELVPQSTHAKVKAIYDQFGTKSEQIPKGFQTIIFLEFTSSVPSIINHLPTTTTWLFNNKPVSLAKHEDIKFSRPDIFMAEVDKVFVFHLKKELIKKSRIPRSDLIKLLQNKYKIRKVGYFQDIINRWKNLGLVEENQNSEVEFLPESP